jgi:hypothetical protein
MECQKKTSKEKWPFLRAEWLAETTVQKQE